MTTFPADEQQISEVERGLCCERTLPLPDDQTLQPGDTVLFALSLSRGGQPAAIVKGGDSVMVSLTGVTPLGQTDPATGHALVRLEWTRLGQQEPSRSASMRIVRPRRSLGRA